MRRRRSGRDHLSDIFYTTGDMSERTVDESFEHSRHYTDVVTQTMLEGERLEQKKAREQKSGEVKKEQQTQKPTNNPLNSQNCL